MFLFGYDTSTIGVDRGMACFAARCVRAIGFFTPFAIRKIMRLGTIILIIWLVIGAIAAGQRN